MKITITGPGVSPSSVGDALKGLEDEYGLKIRDLTMYVRLVNERGNVVDPKLPVNGHELVIRVAETRQEAPLEFEYDEQMQKKFDSIKTEFLNAGIEEDTIKRAFEVTLLQCDMRVPISYLRHMVKHFNNKGIRTVEQVQEYMKKKRI